MQLLWTACREAVGWEELRRSQGAWGSCPGWQQECRVWWTGCGCEEGKGKGGVDTLHTHRPPWHTAPAISGSSSSRRRPLLHEVTRTTARPACLYCMGFPAVRVQLPAIARCLGEASNNGASCLPCHMLGSGPYQKWWGTPAPASIVARSREDSQLHYAWFPPHVAHECQKLHVHCREPCGLA